MRKRRAWERSTDEVGGRRRARKKAAVVLLSWLGEIRMRRTNGLTKVPKVGDTQSGGHVLHERTPRAGRRSSQPSTTPSSSSSSPYHPARFLPFLPSVPSVYSSLFVELVTEIVEKSRDVVSSASKHAIGVILQHMFWKVEEQWSWRKIRKKKHLVFVTSVGDFCAIPYTRYLCTLILSDKWLRFFSVGGYLPRECTSVWCNDVTATKRSRTV